MPSNMFSAHAIKRQARREAWRSDLNPFRKINRASTVPTGQSRDVENGVVTGSEERPPLHNVVSDPGYSRSNQLYDSPKARSGVIEPVAEETEPTSRAVEPDITDEKARTSDPASSSTAVAVDGTRETTISGAGPKQRKKFLRNPWKKDEAFVGPSDAEDEKKGEGEGGKKAHWWMGKDLKHEPFTTRNQIEHTILNSWINILIIAAPVGIALHYAKVNGTIVFVVNFIAIIPLAAMLSFATEEIALHVGEALGGLLNATFGNAVELIVAVLALTKKEFTIVQTSLIGSILSNLLLVLGCCFFGGGLRREEQFFNTTVAQTAASMLALAVAAIVIPTAFEIYSGAGQKDIAAISRGTSIILLFVYVSYLIFQLRTHTRLFNEPSQKVPMKPRKHALPEGALAKGLAKVGGIGAGAGRPQLEDRPPNDELLNVQAHEDEEDEPEMPQLHIATAWATLAGATALIGLCAEFMVDGISDVTKNGAVSVEFVGLILLPIVGNAAEHATAVTVACKDKMDLAIGVAVGSSMQVALFLIPLLVVLGWILGYEEMDLSFDGFQVAVIFVAVLLVNYLIGDGKSHWLEGMLLMCLYIIIAVCAWFYP